MKNIVTETQYIFCDALLEKFLFGKFSFGKYSFAKFSLEKLFIAILSRNLQSFMVITSLQSYWCWGLCARKLKIFEKFIDVVINWIYMEFSNTDTKKFQ